jgi:hypothetical protein
VGRHRVGNISLPIRKARRIVDKMGNANCCEMTKLNCSELKENPPLSYDAKAYPDPKYVRSCSLFSCPFCFMFVLVRAV